MKTARQIEITIYTLLLVGLIFIYNSSIVHSQNVFGNPHRFFILHFGWVILGLLGFTLLSKINYHKILNIAPLLYILTVGLLLFLGLWGVLPCSVSTPFAPCVNSANRWLVLNPAPFPKIPFVGELSFQPSELAKIAIIIFLAFKLKSYSHNDKTYMAFKAYMLYTGVFSALIMMEPNMSTSVLVFLIGSIMYLASGFSIRPFYFLVPIMFTLAIIFVLISPYRRERLMTFINRTHTTSQIEEGYQVNQVKIALGSGGLFGVGFGQSRQKYTYLPEVATDSIFAVIGEEFGFLGSLAICAVFFYLIYKGFEVAKNARSTSGKLLAVGVTSWIGLQFLIHMMANSGVIPYTGVPLPFISYGGSSLLFSMLAMGILINIANTDQ